MAIVANQAAPLDGADVRRFLCGVPGGKFVMVQGVVVAYAWVPGENRGILGLDHVSVEEEIGKAGASPHRHSVHYFHASISRNVVRNVSDDVEPEVLGALAESLDRGPVRPDSLNRAMRSHLKTLTPYLRQISPEFCLVCDRDPGDGQYCQWCGNRHRLGANPSASSDAWLFSEGPVERVCLECSAGMGADALYCGKCGADQTSWEEMAVRLKDQTVQIVVQRPGLQPCVVTGTVAGVGVEKAHSRPRVVCHLASLSLDGSLVAGGVFPFAISPQVEDGVSCDSHAGVSEVLFALHGGSTLLGEPLRVQHCVCGAINQGDGDWCSVCGERIGLLGLLRAATEGQAEHSCDESSDDSRFCNQCGKMRSRRGHRPLARVAPDVAA